MSHTFKLLELSENGSVRFNVAGLVRTMRLKCTLYVQAGETKQLKEESFDFITHKFV